MGSVASGALEVGGDEPGSVVAGSFELGGAGSVVSEGALVVGSPLESLAVSGSVTVGSVVGAVPGGDAEGTVLAGVFGEGDGVVGAAELVGSGFGVADVLQLAHASNPSQMTPQVVREALPCWTIVTMIHRRCIRIAF